MDTVCRQVDPDNPDPRIIRDAAAVLRRGGLVAFPTETVYGLGANALDRDALASIYRAKQRPANDPIIAHIADLEDLDRLAVDIPRAARDLAQRFWPGPLTLVLKRAASVPQNIAAGRDTIAVRMPAHPVAAALIRAAGMPIGAPSANTFTRPSATTAAHVLEDLDGRIDMVLDGGPANIGLESTVVDFSGAAAKVLRPGGIPVESLRELIPGIALVPSYLDQRTPSSAPGQMLKHYSPRANVVLFTGPSEKATRDAMFAHAQRLADAAGKPGLLLSSEDDAAFGGTAERCILGPSAAPAAMGQHLFAAMRELDSRNVDTILVRDYGRSGLGAALWDRLLRAAEGSVVEVTDGKATTTQARVDMPSP